MMIRLEPDEEEEVKTAIEHQDEIEANSEATGWVDERHDAVDRDHHKLDELHRGEIPLPPEMPLDPGTPGGQEVVGVHRAVNQRVPHSTKCCVSTPFYLALIRKLSRKK